MANILSLKDLASVDGVHITMDTKKERAILVEFQNTFFKFHECDDSLYYLDLSTLSDKTYDASREERKERGNDGVDNSDVDNRNERDSDAVLDVGTCHITKVSENKAFFYCKGNQKRMPERPSRSSDGQAPLMLRK